MSHDDGDKTTKRHPKKMEQDQILGSLLNQHGMEEEEVHPQSEHEGEVVHA